MEIRLATFFTRRRLRPFLLGATVLLVVTEIVAFSPSSLEENAPPPNSVDPETLMNQDEVTLATGIPKGRIADYSVDQFNYVSSQGSEKQWKLNADKAFLYSKEKLVHARRIEAFLYDPDGKITVITGKEAKYFMDHRDLEVFGNVHTVFPDGFELYSEYLRYRPNDRHIEIPVKYAVHGGGHEKTGQNLQFESRGLDFAMARSQIVLPEAVRLTMVKRDPPSASPGSRDNDSSTTIESDHAVIHRDEQIAYFTMSPRRALDSRFVRITQPTMVARGRRADLSYGDFSQILNYLVIYDDVLVKETGDTENSLRYGTGGKAVFDSRKEVVVLTEFPQVYQDNDTVTGDVILLHRDTDVVEVEHSNAFSQGTSNSSDAPSGGK